MMKVLKSGKVSSIRGINFVIEELDKHGIGKLLHAHLPELKAQCRYDWWDIFYSYWSVFMSGGDCAEDLGMNFGSSFSHPHLSMPSPDRVLSRLKELATVPSQFIAKRNSSHHFLAAKVHGLKPWYRIKKFIFRFICIPAKWVRKARSWHLRFYGDLNFKT